MVEKKSYLKRVAISVDQLINVVVFNGNEDETMSSRMGKNLKKRDHWISKFV